MSGPIPGGNASDSCCSASSVATSLLLPGALRAAAPSASAAAPGATVASPAVESGSVPSAKRGLCGGGAGSAASTLGGWLCEAATSVLGDVAQAATPSALPQVRSGAAAVASTAGAPSQNLSRSSPGSPRSNCSPLLRGRRSFLLSFVPPLPVKIPLRDKSCAASTDGGSFTGEGGALGTSTCTCGTDL
eukprot:scaffold3541_cov117-Isochrysis_galbana.AAC.10